MENNIVNLLLKLSIVPNIKGYKYLKQALIDGLNGVDVLAKLTGPGGLYATIAEKYDTTESRVERATRHAIEVAFSRTDAETLERVFGPSASYKTGKLPNGAFIGVLLERLKGEIDEQDS